MPKKSVPEFVEPMQASSVKEPFDSPDWIFETKLDGYRAIALIDSIGKARIWSRNHLPFEPKFPTVIDAVGQLGLRSTILDGEIVALDERGRSEVSITPTVAETSDRSGGIFLVRCTMVRWSPLAAGVRVHHTHDQSNLFLGSSDFLSLEALKCRFHFVHV
jgi:hypothetical protein